MNRYIWIIKSNYHGENAQGNILGVHYSKSSAFQHFNMVRDDRWKRAKIAWDTGPENQDPPGMWGPDTMWASFYVNDPKNPETVEMIRWDMKMRKAKVKK